MNVAEENRLTVMDLKKPSTFRAKCLSRSKGICPLLEPLPSYPVYTLTYCR